MAFVLLMPVVSFSFLVPFLLGRIEDRILRGMCTAVLLTVAVIGFALLMAFVESKHIVGMLASVCMVAIVISTIAQRKLHH